MDTFKKLKQCGCPVYLLKCLVYCYQKRQLCVKWGNYLSETFSVPNRSKQWGLYLSISAKYPTDNDNVHNSVCLYFKPIHFKIKLVNSIYFNGIRIKGMEHVANIFMSFDKYFFLEVINILI